MIWSLKPLGLIDYQYGSYCIAEIYFRIPKWRKTTCICHPSHGKTACSKSFEAARTRARWRKVFLIPRGGQQTKRWKCAIWGLWWSSQAKLKQLCTLCHAWHCSVHYLFLTRRLFVRTSRYPSKLVNRLHFKVKIPSSSSTVWIRLMSHRKWNNRPNGLHWPVRPIQPIIPFPVRHPQYPHNTYTRTYKNVIFYLSFRLADKEANLSLLFPFQFYCASSTRRGGVEGEGT